MRLGIFAKTFARCSLGETLDAVKAHGIVCVQFNMSCAGLPTMPEEIPAELADRIRGEMDRRELMMAAVSGTFNMIHPRREKRRAGLRKLAVLAGEETGRGRPDAASRAGYERDATGVYPAFGHSLLSAETYMLAAMEPIFHPRSSLLLAYPTHRPAAGVSSEAGAR